jgi:hypothetical protein
VQSRLDRFALPVDREFDCGIPIGESHRSQAEDEIADDDVSVTFYRDDEINIGELLQEPPI